MQNAGFISEYIFLDLSHLSISTSQLKFDAGASFSSFDFRVNFFWKDCLDHGFVIRLETLLLHKQVPSLGQTNRVQRKAELWRQELSKGGQFWQPTFLGRPKEDY